MCGNKEQEHSFKISILGFQSIFEESYWKPLQKMGDLSFIWNKLVNEEAEDVALRILRANELPLQITPFLNHTWSNSPTIICHDSLKGFPWAMLKEGQQA